MNKKKEWVKKREKEKQKNALFWKVVFCRIDFFSPRFYFFFWIALLIHFDRLLLDCCLIIVDVYDDLVSDYWLRVFHRRNWHFIEFRCFIVSITADTSMSVSKFYCNGMHSSRQANKQSESDYYFLFLIYLHKRICSIHLIMCSSSSVKVLISFINKTWFVFVFTSSVQSKFKITGANELIKTFLFYFFFRFNISEFLFPIFSFFSGYIFHVMFLFLCSS